MAAKFSTIQAAIKAIVAADADLNGTGQVFDYDPPIASVTVDPWAAVVARGNEATFETTSENRRSFNFDVRIFVQRNGTEQASEQKLTGIVDRLLDAFDQDSSLGGLVLMMRAAPSEWSYVLGDKEYRMAEIKLSTEASIDVS